MLGYPRFTPPVSPNPSPPRHPWRYLRDRDAQQAALVTALVLVTRHYHLARRLGFDGTPVAAEPALLRPAARGQLADGDRPGPALGAADRQPAHGGADQLSG
jgi:hypothetical protein